LKPLVDMCAQNVPGTHNKFILIETCIGGSVHTMNRCNELLVSEQWWAPMINVHNDETGIASTCYCRLACTLVLYSTT
jgi:hypothetical protein